MATWYVQVRSGLVHTRYDRHTSNCKAVKGTAYLVQQAVCKAVRKIPNIVLPCRSSRLAGESAHLPEGPLPSELADTRSSALYAAPRAPLTAEEIEQHVSLTSGGMLMCIQCMVWCKQCIPQPCVAYVTSIALTC